MIALEMTEISVADAKNRLSELIARACAGEEIAVTRRGKPVVRLVAVKNDDTSEREARIEAALKRLSALGQEIDLDGDLKTIAREGLD